MRKYITEFKVLEKKIYPNSFFTLKLSHPNKIPEILPGQFVEIKIENHPNVFLRRPISVHDVDYRNNTLSLFIQIVGKGTSELSRLVQGDTLNIVFPLGNHFSILGNKVLLIGGGCGVAPLLYLAKKFQEKNIIPEILVGARSASYIPILETLRKIGTLYVSTEDGSMGTKGLVTQHPILNDDFDRIFTCGPNGMMKAIARAAIDRNIPCELSLENTMACGIGACLCCVVRTDKGHQCVCTDGPVFEATKLKEWIEYDKQEDISCYI